MLVEECLTPTTGILSIVPQLLGRALVPLLAPDLHLVNLRLALKLAH